MEKADSTRRKAPGRKKGSDRFPENIFHSYIYKILKQVSDDTGISVKGMMVVNSLVNDLFQRLMIECKRLALVRKTTTLVPDTIFAACRLLVPHPVHGQLVEFTSKVLINYAQKRPSAPDPSARPTTGVQLRAGLQIPTGRLLRMMRKKWKQGAVRATAAVAMTATIEKIVAIILERAVNHCKESKRIRIIPRELMTAIRTDECLDRLFPGTVASAGVIPLLLPQLLPKTLASN